MSAFVDLTDGHGASPEDESPSSAVIVAEGPMMKKKSPASGTARNLYRRAGANWVERYFILFEDGRLAYHRERPTTNLGGVSLIGTDADAEPDRVICANVGECQVRRVRDPADLVGDMDSDALRVANSFYVIPPGRTDRNTLLVTRGPEQFGMWIAAFRRMNASVPQSARSLREGGNDGAAAATAARRTAEAERAKEEQREREERRKERERAESARGTLEAKEERAQKRRASMEKEEGRRLSLRAKLERMKSDATLERRKSDATLERRMSDATLESDREGERLSEGRRRKDEEENADSLAEQRRKEGGEAAGSEDERSAAEAERRARPEQHQKEGEENARRSEAGKLEREVRAEADRLERENKDEIRRLEEEKLERERQAEIQRRLEEGKLENEEWAEMQMSEEEQRIEREKQAEIQRLEEERIEREKQAEILRLEEERIEREKQAEILRLEEERIEREKQAAILGLEEERIEREKQAEIQRLEEERIEQERIEANIRKMGMGRGTILSMRPIREEGDEPDPLDGKRGAPGKEERTPDVKSLKEGRRRELQSLMKDKSLDEDEKERRMDEVKATYDPQIQEAEARFLRRHNAS